MEKLDLKDRKILYELDINSRQSFSQLGKKVGLSNGSFVLWISCKHKNGKSNEFLIEVGVKK
jgi:hypothetical protein